MLQIDRLIRAAETSFEQIAAASQARESAELALQNQQLIFLFLQFHMFHFGA